MKLHCWEEFPEPRSTAPATSGRWDKKGMVAWLDNQCPFKCSLPLSLTLEKGSCSLAVANYNSYQVCKMKFNTPSDEELG